jgi:hypothetical protein
MRQRIDSRPALSPLKPALQPPSHPVAGHLSPALRLLGVFALMLLLTGVGMGLKNRHDAVLFTTFSRP